MIKKATKYDAADYLETKEQVLAYLQAAFEENDSELLLSALGDVARSKGMAQIARDLGVARESLYRSLAPDGNPSFLTIIKLLEVLGLQITVKIREPELSLV